MRDLEKREPVAEQEAMYRLPYHWFPEERLQRYEREEKKRLVYSLIKSFKNGPIRRYLDVGCGDGRWTTDIHDYLGGDTETIGIDIYERAIGFAKLITPHIDFKVHMAEDIPYPSEHFDLVTAIEIIEHIEDGAEEQVLRELRRVLKKDGLLILTAPTWNLKLTRHHFRHYSVQQLTKLLTSNGFDVLDIKGQSLPCYGIKRRIRRRMGRTPKVWRLWKPTYRETTPEKALNLILAARPKPDE